MPRSKLSDRILKEKTKYIDSEEYDSDVKHELVRLYKNNDSFGIVDLLETIWFAYDNFYEGYENIRDAFEFARRTLELYSIEADEELMNIEQKGKVREFYNKSIGYFPEKSFFKNFSLN